MTAVRTAPTTEPQMTASELLQRLRRHYIKPGEALPGGVFLPELQAPHVSRRIDALYLGFTHSRGQRLVGHEIKVRRQDWLKELEQPEKAEGWYRHCHEWYVVAPSIEIVPLEELPQGWGLMVVSPRPRTRLDIVRRSEVHEPEVTLGLLLEIAKRLDLGRAEDRREVQAELGREIEQRAAEIAEREINARSRQAASVAKELDVWEEATGLSLSIRSDRSWVKTEDLKTHGRLLARFIASANARDRALREIDRTQKALKHLLKTLSQESQVMSTQDGGGPSGQNGNES